MTPGQAGATSGSVGRGRSGYRAGARGSSGPSPRMKKPWHLRQGRFPELHPCSHRELLPPRVRAVVRVVFAFARAPPRPAVMVFVFARPRPRVAPLVAAMMVLLAFHSTRAGERWQEKSRGPVARSPASLISPDRLFKHVQDSRLLGRVDQEHIPVELAEFRAGDKLWLAQKSATALGQF